MFMLRFLPGFELEILITEIMKLNIPMGQQLACLGYRRSCSVNKGIFVTLPSRYSLYLSQRHEIVEMWRHS